MFRKHNIRFRILFVLGIILAGFYFLFFFQKGILFEGAFLKQIKTEHAYQYKGKVYGEPVTITQTGNLEASKSAEITYKIGDWYDHTFKVNLFHTTDYNSEIYIYKDSQLWFEGIYQPGKQVSFHLLDKDGNLPDDIIRVSFHNEGPFSKDYQVSKYDIAGTFFQDKIILRGNWGLLFMAVFLLLITFIDWKWPLLFFQMRHFLSVRDPEPSDFYLAIQKLGWYVYPVIAAALLIAGLFVR